MQNSASTTFRFDRLENIRDYGSIEQNKEESMLGSRVKLDKALLIKAKRFSDLAGYSSVEEFITHALEKEIAQFEGAESEQELKKRLRGLGYIS